MILFTALRVDADIPSLGDEFVGIEDWEARLSKREGI